MTNYLDRGVHIAAGDGIVARIGGFVAYANGDATGLNQLVVRLNALADAPWPEIVRTITSDIVSAGYSAHPLLACATIEEDRVRALVFGDLQLLVVTDAHHQVLDGSESSTWIDVAVHGDATKLQCGEPEKTDLVGVLRDGVVPSGGFMFDANAPIPAAIAWGDIDEAPLVDAIAVDDAAIEDIPVDDVPVEPSAEDKLGAQPDLMPALVDVADEPTAAETADFRALHELVNSLERTRGTSPAVDRQHEPSYVITGERPSLGTLTFDDGASLELTRPVVIGRGVPERYAVDGEAATTVLLDDTQGMISNVHLEVRLVGSSVELVDKESETGTFLQIAESGDRVRLESGVSTAIQPKTLVEVGQRSFTFTVGD